MAGVAEGRRRGWSCRVCARRKPCCLRFQLCSNLFCLWAAEGRMLFGFRASSGLAFLFKTLFISTVMVLSGEVSFGVLGRSQQQGRTIIDTEDGAVLPVKEAGPRRLARGACTQVEAGGRGGSGSSRGTRAEAGGWLRRAGPAVRPSQRGLQGRVQDVVAVAVAVGVAVIALGAGVVGSFLQPHQHVHLGKERRPRHGFRSGRLAAPGLSKAHATSCRLTLGTVARGGRGHGPSARLPGFKSRLHHLLAA